MGYIPKNTASAVMLSALCLVLSGGIYMPPSITQKADKNQLSSLSGITPRQKQLLELMEQSHSNKIIASKLGLAEGVVKMPVTSIISFGLSAGGWNVNYPRVMADVNGSDDIIGFDDTTVIVVFSANLN